MYFFFQFYKIFAYKLEKFSLLLKFMWLGQNVKYIVSSRLSTYWSMFIYPIIIRLPGKFGMQTLVSNENCFLILLKNLKKSTVRDRIFFLISERWHQILCFKFKMSQNSFIIKTERLMYVCLFSSCPHSFRLAFCQQLKYKSSK